jgi:hypothetical protein
MGVKKHKLYRPKGLGKEEEKYLNAQLRRELIMTIIVVIIGIAVVVALFGLTKQAVTL